MGKIAMLPGSTSIMPFVVREIQSTPNPNAIKFVLDRPISEQPVSFFNAAAAEGHPIGRKLFQIPGVTSILLLGDFVTVNKTADTKWPGLKSKVRRVFEEA